MPDETPQGRQAPQLYRGLFAIFVGSGEAVDLLAFLEDKGVKAHLSLPHTGQSFIIELAPETNLDGVEAFIKEWMGL